MASGAPIQYPSSREWTPLHRARRIHADLWQEQQTYLPTWRKLAKYFAWRQLPALNAKPPKPNDGVKPNTHVLNPAALLSLRTAASGLQGGTMSPTRPWFRLTLEDPDLGAWGPVKRWLADCERILYSLFSASNTYKVSERWFFDLILFGQSPMSMEETLYTETRRLWHCRVHPIGTYALGVDDEEEVKQISRVYSMHVWTALEKYGYANLCEAVRRKIDSKQWNDIVNITQLVMPNVESVPGSMLSKDFPFKSMRWEEERDDDDGFLSESGFEEQAVFVPRWNPEGCDAYAHGPAHLVLGQQIALQNNEKRKDNVIKWESNPPKQGPKSLENTGINQAEGAMNYVPDDLYSSGHKIESLWNTRLDLNAVLADIAAKEQSCRKAFFEDLFLMLASSDRRQITAEEIVRRFDEQVRMLGPVVQSINHDGYDPMIDRAFGIAQRRGALPPPPDAIQDGATLKVEYISLLAQAQKLATADPLEAYVSFTSRLAQESQDPAVWDNCDKDQAQRAYADAVGVNPDVLPDADVVQARRSARAQLAEQERAAAMQQQASETARNLGAAPVNAENALGRISEQLGVPL